MTSTNSSESAGPLTADQALKQAISHHQLGQLHDAGRLYRAILHVHPNHPDAKHNLWLIEGQVERNQLVELFNAGCYAEVESRAGVLVEQNPKAGFVWKVYGAALMVQGKEALIPLRKAVELLPNDAEAYSNLGGALYELGQLDAARMTCLRALEINCDSADAHNNLGNVLKELGQLDGAESCYRRALEIVPDFAWAHNNLASTLKNLGRIDEAEKSCRRALQIKPDFIEALNNLALILNDQGQFIEAFNTIKQSLHIKETGQAKTIFMVCIKRLRFTHDDTENRLIMVRAITEPWGRPGELIKIGTDLLKSNPAIAGAVARANNAWPSRLSAQELFGVDGFAVLADDPLAGAMLISAHNCGIEMERFLTMARWVMLEAAIQRSADDVEDHSELKFYGALACQCFINEYVFSQTDEEIQKVNKLLDLLITGINANSQVPNLWLVSVAAYFPLYTLPCAAQLMERSWPEAVEAVLVQQIREPQEEQRLRNTIPRLTEIEDEISLLVQGQYEEHPYPRWVKLEPAEKSKNIVGYLCQGFPLASFNREEKMGRLDVLIAGCGTGQHPIGTARRLQGAQVLAVDLSASSLSYAKRKTKELGLASIEYGQADILKLGSIGRSFDLIESVGVLHHLADPFAGWRVLLSLLRPSGFMWLGFYSEVARRNIVSIRELITKQGYGSTADEIRRCRQDLVELDKSADFGIAIKTSDFFSTSACRDLLFHVQEHRLTLTAISSFLNENNLTFLGFDMDPNTLHAYKLRFPEDPAATNLGLWQIFEAENPETFFSMYQFWIQKN